MRRPGLVLLASFLLLFSGSKAWAGDEVYQLSTITALLEGVLEGEATVRDVTAHGDFGIGTFNDLDGEMIVVDGLVYQVRGDGKAYPVDLQATRTPFATVTKFDKDFSCEVEPGLEYPAFLDFLDSKLPTKNVIYAFRVDGEFSYVKTRSVPAQKKPYPKLEEVVKTQPTFEFKDVKGSLVGFRFPESMAGVNVPGWHFHFLTADHEAGGHVLALTTKSGTAVSDLCARLDLELPASEAFYKADLSAADKTALIRVEK